MMIAVRFSWPPSWRRAGWWASGAGVLLAGVAGWALLTEDVRVWPVRNTLEYQVVKWWWSVTGIPSLPAAEGTVAGTVHDERGRPVEGARVVLVTWDGTTYQGSSATDGQFLIRGVPLGTYTAIAGAPGHNAVSRSGVRSDAGWGQTDGAKSTAVRVDFVLPAVPEVPPSAAFTPGRDFTLRPEGAVSSEVPLPGRALRWTVNFESGGRASQLTLYYTPPAPSAGPLPVLLAVYPGPADTWESASVPLAEAGFAVIAVGPAYSFALEHDVDELARIVQFVREGRFPGTDGRRIAVLGGSYSALHVQRLLQREYGTPAISAAVLLGAPTDLFDMRRRFEDGTFIPPFGLDQALVALGFPDREPLRYWRYSGVYHVRAGMPPTLVIHSRSDDVVPYQQSELLAEAFTHAGVPHELHIFDGGSHYLLSNETDARAIQRLTLDFLSRYLV